jgi:hypothetical protein
MNTELTESQPIACDLTAIPTNDRKQHILTVQQIFQAVQQAQELPNGYAFQLPNQPGMFMSLAQFVENERLCCPFYNFVLEVEPNGGPLWLRLTGTEGVKELLEVISGDLQEAVRKQLIQTGDDVELDEAVAQAFPVVADSMRKASTL